jgi:predicted Zn-dependent protease with MMP-like domain
MKFTAEEFEALVVAGLEALPPEIQAALQNIEVVVAEWPTAEEMRSVGLGPGRLLLGLYQGVPLTKRGGHYNMTLPDKVTIFQGPIEQVCRTPEQIIRQVQRTVRHEIAHHFGLSDDRLRELGAY